ncbi:reverse transcriptase domain-containing protein [Tanacetum coccineum]|uniref:Reverse transcriptase domain-containing protein n=1 Tax=Tanacetum coccineum TaxID=301880 RepID=A0ABQ5ADT3_9ASTR
MSNAQPTPSHPRSDVRNTVRKDKQTPQGSARTTSAVDLEELCEKHYEKLLPIMADKYEHERRKKEKLEEVKARLDFGDVRKRTTKTQESTYSESRTRSPRRHRRSHSPRQSSSVFTRLKRERSRSPRHDQKNKARRESNVFKRLGSRGRSVSAYSDSRQENSRYTEKHSESEDSGGGHWKSKSQKQKPSIEDDDLSKPWVCAETDLFMSRMFHFSFPKTRMPCLIKTYDRSGDPKDHLKIFQAAAKTERWAMPTCCHMFNSTLTGNARVWFDDLPPESIHSYDDLREAFLKNYLQQKKYIRDPIVLHNIKQKDGESTEDFIQRYKSESGNVKGAPVLAFTISADVPKILMQQFWYTITKIKGSESYELLLADKRCVIDVEVFRKIFDICQRKEGEDFTEVQNDEDTLTFLVDLGYSSPFHKYTNMFVDHMHGPWRTLAACINKCLSGKTTSNDKLRKSRINIPWGMFYRENVDYPYLIWEDIAYQIDHRREKKSRRENMPYPRFTKVIIDYFLSKHKSLKKLKFQHFHTIKNDSVVSRLKFVRMGEDCRIPLTHTLHIIHGSRSRKEKER